MVTIEAIREHTTEVLHTWELCQGLGNLEDHRACSIAALNIGISLAKTGKLPLDLTDSVPECACRSICHWVVQVQDSMPLSILDSEEWVTLVPLIAGSRSTYDVERVRVALIMNWAWRQLQQVQGSVPSESKELWDVMLRKRTLETTAACISGTPSHHLANAAHRMALALKLLGDPGSGFTDVIYNAVSAVNHVSEKFDPATTHLAFWRKADPAGMLAKLLGVVAYEPNGS